MSTSGFKRLFIANRGEVAMRIARAAADLGIVSVACYAPEDSEGLHLLRADEAVALPGHGVAAYLDVEAITEAALRSRCDAVHPGYGFLSENAQLARRCAEKGLVFIGPRPEVLDLFGDKVAARRLVEQLGLPLARGTAQAVSLAEARDFLAQLGPGRSAILKAVAGGGGRGMRVVESAEQLEDAYTRAASEARAAFGADALYIEELIAPARHIEVQVAGDASGQVVHLHERECSLQRRHQKLVEIAPAPGLSADLRERMQQAALALARAAKVHTLCTFEFLVDLSEPGRFVFIEANPRLQVEHTVTEEITGIDLVQAQIRLAGGASLSQLGLQQQDIPAPQGCALQLRINMERIGVDGVALPSSGRLHSFDVPSGRGVRLETQGYTGLVPPTSFDSLLAKLIVHTPSGRFADLAERAYRALGEFRIEGVDTNIGFLLNLMRERGWLDGQLDTRFVERHAIRLAAAQTHPLRHASAPLGLQEVTTSAPDAGVSADMPQGTRAQTSPMGGRLVRLMVVPGQLVVQGQAVAVIEAMKMEHTIGADCSGRVLVCLLQPGDSVVAGAALCGIEPQHVSAAQAGGGEAGAPAGPDLALEALRQRRHAISDAGRPEAVAALARRGLATARQRIEQLCDAGSFHEIGGLIRNTSLPKDAPADGVVAGSARIDGRHVMVVAQDFSVFGGSSGHLGEAKMQRVVRQAQQQGFPLVMLLDGGGHRIQDGQSSREYARATPIFHDLARISGWVPVVCAMMGFGFAANTNYASMADLVIMVRGQSTMGLAGPALVKAGTGQMLEVQALGGAQVQVERNGLADMAVDSEQEALEAIRRFLSFLPSNAGLAPPGLDHCQAPDAQALTGVVPANTRQAYDAHRVVDGLIDLDSGFEFKPGFASNVVTCLGRLQGRPVGLIANQPQVRSGVLDAPAAEKMARFIGLCDAFGLPLVFLVDIPGLQIGPAAESTMLGRRSAKILFELGHATVPRVSIVLRKGYGLGYLAMCGGRSFDADACLAWPTAEICAMSVEGSVDVAYRKVYEADADPVARRQALIDEIRAEIDPIKAAEGFGIDDLIEPHETRERLLDILARAPARRSLNLPPKHRAIAPI
ncbi:carboxyl transferase domain-containing protein [Hydrogenophaga sp.]|uniref:acetyl-CoA carboxylase family protein n=1 Tax=Hydrogenophaga sp. TaxID=1904254 RepID=UPI0027360E71|nr:carboxyl transferase domain-containing protein [Hydrogenophaga sp.]MDP3806143.1 carboxyl transferase domain-containing protein [Hydrogenophaga sp.]